MQVRWSWVATAAMLLGYFVAMPDEGTAATKRRESLSLNFSKIEFSYLEVEDPGLPPPRTVSGLTFGLESSNSGPLGSSGAPLPTVAEVGVFAEDSFGTAHAASQDVFFTGLPASFPPLSAHHLTMNFTQPGTLTSGLASILHVSHDPADPSTLDKSYWQADVGIAMPGTAEYSYTFFVEANPDQPGLSLKSVQTSQAATYSPGVPSFFDVFVELEYDGSLPIDPSQPVLWISTSATPEPTSATLIAAAAAMLLRRRR